MSLRIVFCLIRLLVAHVVFRLSSYSFDWLFAAVQAKSPLLYMFVATQNKQNEISLEEQKYILCSFVYRSIEKPLISCIYEINLRSLQNFLD